MTPLQICNTIRTRFKTLVATPQSLTTLYDNAPVPSRVKGTTWCRFTVDTGGASKITCGTSEFRNIGQATAQLFCPTGSGDGAILALATIIEGIFKDQAVDGIRYLVPTIVRAGQYEDEYQINVVCPFQVDTV
jgi:hypothetical protein